MAESETGWTDEFPANEETFYWIRHKQNHADINVGLLRDRTLLLAEGTTHSKAHRRWDFEYLPASPADAEHLSELRKVAQTALTWMEWWVEGDEVKAPLRSRDVLNQLCAALNPKHPEKET